MMFMNEWDIEEAKDRHESHPVLGPATRTLKHFMDIVNANSDGWPYWSAAPKAARKLMELIQNPATATEAAYRKALTPIRTLLTKNNLPAL